MSSTTNNIEKLSPASKRGGRRRRKRRKKLIILLIILAVGLVIYLYFFNIILPMYLLTSTTSTLMSEEFLDTSDNVYNAPVGPGGGHALSLSGGLEAMGVDFEATITDLQTKYAAATMQDEKNELAGKIAYAQLYQILNAETEVSDHPVLLLGTAMGIREMSIFSNNYKSFTTSKMVGPDLAQGIWGTWCNGYINGLPNNGGGVITHDMSRAEEYAIVSPNESIPPLNFQDVGNGGYTTLNINQKWSTVASTGTGKDAIGYNKGAYGPMQIEADHWITWVCPYVQSDSDYNSYKGKAFLNIPITDRRFDDLQSAQKSPLAGHARSIVTSSNSHLSVLRQNKTFVDNIMATVGHQNYIAEYANIVNNTAEGQAKFGSGTGYYFADRFTKGQDWEDWVMSLEAWPHAFTCFALDRIGRFCMFTNPGQIKNASGDILADNAFKSKLTSTYGSEFTFVNETAENIYWSLEMLQSWNFGAPCANYNKDTRPQWHNTAWFYRELANYIAVNGTAAIRADESINPKGKCTCGNRVSVYSGTNGLEHDACTAYAHQVYVNLTNFLCTANGTSPEIRNKIITMFNTHQNQGYHKNNYGYAVTGILDAEANAQVIMRDLFGLTEFNIFNYGAAPDVEMSEAPTINGSDSNYDYADQVAQSAPVSNTYFYDAAFIGDTLTNGLIYYSACSGDYYSASTADMAVNDLSVAQPDGSFNSLAKAFETINVYSKFYIMLGINELNVSATTFESNYRALVQTIKKGNPNAVIYIQSILPVDPKNIEHGISNDTIQERNNLLRRLAQSERCIYINVRQLFEEGTVALKNDCWESDGIMLKEATYNEWYEYLKTHTVQNGE